MPLSEKAQKIVDRLRAVINKEENTTTTSTIVETTTVTTVEETPTKTTINQEQHGN